MPMRKGSKVLGSNLTKTPGPVTGDTPRMHGFREGYHHNAPSNNDGRKEGALQRGDNGRPSVSATRKVAREINEGRALGRAARARKDGPIQFGPDKKRK